MPNTLKITTTTHPAVLTMYGAQIVLGFLNMIGVQKAISMTEMFGAGVFNVWASFMLYSGIFALWGAVMAPLHKEQITAALRIEMVGCIGIFVTQGFYEWTLASGLGMNSLQTQVMALSLAVAGLTRAIQIVFELKKVRKAKTRSQPPLSETNATT